MQINYELFNTHISQINNDSTFVETANRNVNGSKYVQNRIQMTLNNKSLTNNGPTMLKLFRFDSLGTEINWKEDDIWKST